MAEIREPATDNLVALRRDPALPYDDEARTRCFILYATAAARNCASVARLYAEEVEGLDLPAPDRATIARWAAEDRWYDQADDLWRQTKGRTVHELNILMMANTVLAQRRLHDILAGHDERPVEERVITLKAIETQMRSRERLPELARIDPPEPERDTADQPREARESTAMAAIARGTRRRHG